MWRRMIPPGGEGGRSREPGARMGEDSEGRHHQWGGNQLRRVTHDNYRRAVVEDHTALLLSAPGSVRKEALCRIRKGSEASRVLYHEMSGRLLQLACKDDAVECARLLLEGGSRIMASPVDQLYDVAAETHSARCTYTCIELLPSKNALADLRVVDRRPLLPLDIVLTRISFQSYLSMDIPMEDLLSSFLHKMVNIHFCDKKFRIPPTKDTNVIDLVHSVLLENKITTKDFYLRMNGKMLDDTVLVDTIISSEEPNIYVCPRLRGGVHPLYECTYERFIVILTNNSVNLLRNVVFPQNLISPNGSPNATFLTPLSHSMLHGLLAHVLSDGHLTRQVTWGGQFTINDVLISADGHIMIDPAIVPEGYTDVGGEKDYIAINSIAKAFVPNQQKPVHFDHLLKLLISSTADLRRNRLFVLFLVCHPSLLIYCEKYKLYGLVELLLNRLTTTEDTELDKWLLNNSVGHDQWHSLVGNTTLFNTTFMYNAKKIGGIKVTLYKFGLRQGFRFGRNYEAHPPTGIPNSLAEDALDHTFFFLLTIVLEGLVKTLQPGQSTNDFADILSNMKGDPATMRNVWALAQQNPI